MAVNPQVTIPVTIADEDPNIPGSGTSANAASLNPNFAALRDAHNTHSHTDLAFSADLNTHTQLTTAAHGGIVADTDARVNSFFNTSRIASTFASLVYTGTASQAAANMTANTVRAARIVVPFTGTLCDLSILVGTASGNIIAGIYNTAGTRSSQYNTGTIAMAGTNAWQVVAFNTALSTTVTGNQTVAPGGALTVGSTTGFTPIGSIVSGGNTYAYTSLTGTTFVLSAGGTFTGAATVTQAGLAVTAGTHLDFAIMQSDATGTLMTRTIPAGMGQLPNSNYLIVSGGALPKLTWSFAPGAFTWQTTVTEANASAANTLVPLMIARVA